MDSLFRLHGHRARHLIRIGFAVWALLNGIFVLLLAFHLRVYGPFFGLSLERSAPWLTQHGVISGVLLLYIARHIYYGQRRAAWLLLILFIAQMLRYSLFGFEPVLFALSTISAIGLIVSWRAFDRNTATWTVAARVKDALSIIGGVVIAASLLVALAASTNRLHLITHQFEHLYDTRIATHASDSREDRFDRSIHRLRPEVTGLLASVVALVLWSLFRPVRPTAGNTSKQDRAEIERLLTLAASSSEDYFKVWPHDKRYYMSPEADGFIAYKVAGSVAFVLADPISVSDRNRLIGSFLDFCKQCGWSVCVMLFDQMNKPLYEKAGLKTLPIGSSARIDIAQFATETVRDKWWRWQRNRATKAGLTYEKLVPPHSQQNLKELRTLSDDWLTRAGHGEQGFALGYYSDEYLQRCRLHVLRDSDGQAVAFANQLPTYNDQTQTTVDLIRFRPDVNGAMPVLIMHIIDRLHEEAEFTYFDLGFVPLAKVDSTVATLAKRVASGRFSAQGLEQFKDKFRPEWQPQYLAYDGDLINLAVLVSNLERVMAVGD